MKKLILILCVFASFSVTSQRFAQNNEVDYDAPEFEVVKDIIDEAKNNSQLEILAHELLDLSLIHI